MNFETPSTFLGFDYGTRSIGVAVGQSITRTAKALTAVKAVDGKPHWDSIKKLINEWQPQALVVGLPLNMDGTSQPLTEKARYFAQQLREIFDLPVYEEDERLTTVEAKAALFERGGFRSLKKEAIDSLSAQLILEDWMSSNIT